MNFTRVVGKPTHRLLYRRRATNLPGSVRPGTQVRDGEQVALAKVRAGFRADQSLSLHDALGRPSSRLDKGGWRQSLRSRTECH